MSSARPTCAAPEPSASALAEVYSLAIERYKQAQKAAGEQKEAARCDQHRDGDDGTEIKGDSAYGRSIQ